ncbi:hypothetical protein EVAR_21374_1 [Eumeta japonica]|uniref:Uncharacterized protein n=1 Tax=Eumeta variegata TaxID=151549 RepID=A0A4C1YBP6_EUMVA|nr:hypothetical protein EVAR_21374_1 [Eumeta japonica]
MRPKECEVTRPKTDQCRGRKSILSSRLHTQFCVKQSRMISAKRQKSFLTECADHCEMWQEDAVTSNTSLVGNTTVNCPNLRKSTILALGSFEKEECCLPLESPCLLWPVHVHVLEYDISYVVEVPQQTPGSIAHKSLDVFSRLTRVSLRASNLCGSGTAARAHHGLDSGFLTITGERRRRRGRT